MRKENLIMKTLFLLATVSLLPLSEAIATKTIKIGCIETDASARQFFETPSLYYDAKGMLSLFPSGSYIREQTKPLIIDSTSFPNVISQSLVTINKEITLPEWSEGLTVRAAGADVINSNIQESVQHGSSYKIILKEFQPNKGSVGKKIQVYLEEIRS
jgi:hypothetical protein